MGALSVQEQEELDLKSLEHDRYLARLETLAVKLLEMCDAELRETVNHCRLKQSMTVEEYDEAMENQEAENEEAMDGRVVLSVDIKK